MTKKCNNEKVTEIMYDLQNKLYTKRWLKLCEPKLAIYGKGFHNIYKKPSETKLFEFQDINDTLIFICKKYDLTIDLFKSGCIGNCNTFTYMTELYNDTLSIQLRITKDNIYYSYDYNSRSYYV